MYTSIVFIALAGLPVALVPSQNGGIDWQKDYTQAREMAGIAKKPMAVFIGNGHSGYELVCKDAKLSAEMQKALAASYVCVYLDTSTTQGQKSAADFGNSQGLGLILSDRTGDLQAFSHVGDLSAADLSRWLSYAADPNLVVRTTMNNASPRISTYPPSSYSGQGSFGTRSQFFGAVCTT